MARPASRAAEEARPRAASNIRSGEADLDPLVAFALAANAQHLHPTDLGEVADVGAAAGLEVDAGNPQQAHPTRAARRLHAQGFDPLGLGVQFRVGDPDGFGIAQRVRAARSARARCERRRAGSGRCRNPAGPGRRRCGRRSPAPRPRRTARAGRCEYACGRSDGPSRVPPPRGRRPPTRARPVRGRGRRSPAPRPGARRRSARRHRRSGAARRCRRVGRRRAE